MLDLKFLLSIVVYFNEYGIPYDTNIIEAMIALGILVQLSSWVLTPSKTMIKVAKEGNLPKFFQKTNKDDIPITFIFIPAIVISFVTLLYIIVP